MTCILLRRPRVALGISSLAVVAASCTAGPNYTTPGAKVASRWMENPAVMNRPAHPAEAFWWRSFGDSVLNELVETAHRNNPTLQIAGRRVLEANKSIGNVFLQQQAISAQAGYTRLNDGLASRIPSGGWELRAGQDVISEEVKAEMARRTDWGRMLEPSRHLPRNPARAGSPHRQDDQRPQSNIQVKPNTGVGSL